MNCPRCHDAALDEVRCSRCGGAWISAATIDERVAHAQHRRRPTLDWQPAHRDAIACPACAAAMETLTLFEVPVDRCAAHGVWLDKDELEQIVQRAGTS